MSFVLTEKPLALVDGEGVELIDDEGTSYLDMGASYGCAPVGHGHPTVVEAVESQLRSLSFVHASYPIPIREQLVERLDEVTPDGLGHVWLANSGTEANEAALKFARSATGRSKLVATHRGFHGRTMGSLSVTWKPKYRVPYEPMLDDVEFVPFGDAEALDEAVDDEVAAVILEPIQGEGGVRPARSSYLRHAREVTESTGAALILDEVQTGLGRTGTFWACNGAGVEPDIVTAAKGLASGLPIGATICADWIADGAASHGSTYGGNPVVATAAVATLDLITEEGLVSNAATTGAQLKTRIIEEVDEVSEVRGVGLLIGIDIDRPVGPVLRRLALEEQVLALEAGRRTIRLLPPLTLEQEHVDHFIEALNAVLMTQEVSP